MDTMYLDPRAELWSSSLALTGQEVFSLLCLGNLDATRCP